MRDASYRNIREKYVIEAKVDGSMRADKKPPAIYQAIAAGWCVPALAPTANTWYRDRK
jgi:hypothetical protein